MTVIIQWSLGHIRKHTGNDLHASFPTTLYCQKTTRKSDPEYSCAVVLEPGDDTIIDCTTESHCRPGMLFCADSLQ